MVVLALFLFIVTMLFSIYTTQSLWNWFMPPLLGLPVLSFWEMAGVGLTIGVMTRYKGYAKKNDDESFTDKTIGLCLDSLVFYWAMLTTGWLYTKAAF